MTHIAIDIQDEQNAAHVLAWLERERIPYRVESKPQLSGEERAKAQKRMMKGAPTVDTEKMLEWLKESREDRRLPLRDVNE